MLTGPFDKRMGTNYRMPLVVGLPKPQVSPDRLRQLKSINNKIT